LKPVARFEYPSHLQIELNRAKRLVWITQAYLVSAIVLMALVLGQSQAMKTVWLEDILSLVPGIAFLVSAHFASKPPSERFPYGYHRVVSISFLVAALALCAMGAFLLYESIATLVKREHPTLGAVHLFGHTIWLGWLTFPVLLYSGLPAVFLGRMKIPLAEKLHDKVLNADATMNADDWLTAAAGMVGVFGIGMGWWWMDAAAAGFISFRVLKDGWTRLKDVVTGLMDEEPTNVKDQKPSPLPGEVEHYLRSLPWVQDVVVRMREQGHVYFGEAFVVPRSEHNLVENIESALSGARELDWKMFELSITPVAKLSRDYS